MSQLIELTPDECLELLSTGVIGRVAVCTPVGPRLVPVNYSLHRDAIVWRTTPYSELASYGNHHDALFEVDDIDYAEVRAWSVIAAGQIEIVDDPDEVADIRRIEDPRPWADGYRHLYMRLIWRSISGRRIGETTRDARLMVSPDLLIPPTYR